MIFTNSIPSAAGLSDGAPVASSSWGTRLRSRLPRWTASKNRSISASPARRELQVPRRKDSIPPNAGVKLRRIRPEEVSRQRHPAVELQAGIRGAVVGELERARNHLNL